MANRPNRAGIEVEIREFLKLAIPLASAQLAQAGTGFIDTVMMGWLGQETLAAGGLAVMIFMSLMMTGTGVVAAVSPLVAEAYGSRQNRQIGLITRQGLWLALLLAIPGTLIMGHLGGVLHHLGQSPITVALSDRYLSVIQWGLFPALGFAVLRGTIISLSQARPVMIIVLAATLFNVIANYILAFGVFGFPRLELTGLALASTLAHWIMFLSLLGYLLKNASLRKFHLWRSLHQLDLTILKRLLWVGVPVGISAILEYGSFTVLTLMMGALGVSTLAAHQVALQTIMIFFMVPLAMSYAATARIGQWYGQRHWKQVKQAAVVSLGLAASFMLVAAIALFLYPRQIVGLYLDGNDPANAEVVRIGLTLLTVAACGQMLDGIQRTANGILQGLQDTRIPMLLSILGYWGVGLTTSYVLGFHTALAGAGVWIGSYIGLSVAAGAYLWRFQYLLARFKRQEARSAMAAPELNSIQKR